MDFEMRIKSIKKDMQNNLRHLEEVENEYNESKDFTSKFLENCLKVGIEVVSINKKTELIPTSLDFPFGVNGNAFAEETFEGWPAIWKACDMSNLSGGCGNGGQRQLNQKAMASLVDGVYEFKNNQWKKVD